ncbi:hypothetical protein HELRODRAFT_114944 [Helobdella robusta]|uniref:Peptidase S1 domain-containing protein n=1 Tax=Helobdella robusta TaxID=6412 RepID=T1EG55_HELRO|nr:hypothetical protein HELRODRAFT_114944 [Helobdella robusta]ESN94998.1 hypothetical protein HELRODRAFT_114944 [Helobdella robusta]
MNEKPCRENGKCLPTNYFCDGIRDCLDNSDETNCGIGIFVVVVFLHCGMRMVQPPLRSTNIVNGNQAPMGAWPWFAIVKVMGMRICGGVIVSYLSVMTSASCLGTIYNQPISAEAVAIFVGTNKMDGSSGQGIRVSKIFIHPDFDPSSGMNDIAILQMDHSIMFDDNVQSICLPDFVHDRNLSMSQFKSCYIAGFGANRAGGPQSKVLLQGRVNLLSHRECISHLYNMTTAPFKQYVNYTTHICAGIYSNSYGSNMCEGDEGGPLMCETITSKWVLVGISTRHPGQSCKSSVFSRVSSFIPFYTQLKVDTGFM